jgi:hypothetical protein
MGGTLGVVFRHRPLQQFDCDRMLDSVREVFAANNIDVDLRCSEVASLGAPQMSRVSVNGCSSAIFEHGAMFRLVPLVSPDELVVFIVQSIADGIGPFAGCAEHPPGTPGLVITEAAARGGLSSSAANGRWVLAHELAHVLGVARHDVDSTKLLNESATAITAPIPLIDRSQQNAINSSRCLGRTGFSRARVVPERTIPVRETPSHFDRPRSHFDRRLR